MKFTPGPGLGGHCIPIDPYYLSWKLKTLDYDARFIKLAGEINTYMPVHVINLISSSLNKNKKSINGSKILIIGVAYKKDIDDCRESPALDVIKLLEKSGSEVMFYDPYVSKIEYTDLKLKGLSNLNIELIAKVDACVILTNHSNVNYQILLEHSNLIIDTRNVYSNVKSNKIQRLGEG